jgi:hypothetical protein
MRLELVGRKFGRLTVISFDTMKNNQSIWKCLCDCGNGVEVRGNQLTSGNTRSCGCLSLDSSKESGKRNLGRMKPGLNPTRHPEMKDVYWVAGIYEGEGCCSINNSKSRVAEANIAQKDTWLLDKLKSLFGGHVCGSKSHPNIGYWQISGTRARGFLMTIYSLLSPRRQGQIKKVLKG